ncbi:MAG TPA: histidine kinase [Candidatus Limnocylindrales bacterium]|nr:histidine kinase [Candidatus Limnocylindrales bacterium]
MESGTLASRLQAVQLDDAEPDGQMAMALLAAHEQERSRLAEELHDGPAQALANAIFQIEILDRAVRDDPAAAREELASLRAMLERELDTLRGYINQLRPSLNEAAGLEEALRDSAEALTQQSGVPIELRIEASGGELRPAARAVVLRVAQEAMRNIAKHSSATKAWLATRTRVSPDGEHQWILEVGDDGRGFDYQAVAAHPNKRHFGLRFMRERADLLGSDLAIQTDPAGTVVRLTIVTTGGERS